MFKKSAKKNIKIFSSFSHEISSNDIKFKSSMTLRKQNALAKIEYVSNLKEPENQSWKDDPIIQKSTQEN